MVGFKKKKKKESYFKIQKIYQKAHVELHWEFLGIIHTQLTVLGRQIFYSLRVWGKAFKNI